MRIQEILDLAMTLKPVERLLIIDGLLRSLDEPDHNIDELWAVEAEKRLNACREGRVEGIPIEEVFQKKNAFF